MLHMWRSWRRFWREIREGKHGRSIAEAYRQGNKYGHQHMDNRFGGPRGR